MSEIYSRYYNNSFGLENDIDCNIKPSEIDFGVFNHAVFIILLDLSGVRKRYSLDKFHNDITLDFHTFRLNILSDKANIVKFNIVSLLAILLRYKNSYSWQIIIDGIFKHGLKSFFIFNTKTPISPAYWCLFFNAARKYKHVENLLFPLLFCKVLLSRKVSENILNLVILHCFNSKPQYKFLHKLFVRKMKRKYGDNFIEVLMKLHYNNANHPNIQYSVGVTVKET